MRALTSDHNYFEDFEIGQRIRHARGTTVTDGGTTTENMISVYGPTTESSNRNAVTERTDRWCVTSIGSRWDGSNSRASDVAISKKADTPVWNR